MVQGDGVHGDGPARSSSSRSRRCNAVCGDATLYARNGDAADLAEQIRKLADSEALRQQLGEAARMRLLGEGLSWPDQVPTLSRPSSARKPARGQHRHRQLPTQPEQGHV